MSKIGKILSSAVLGVGILAFSGSFASAEEDVSTLGYPTYASITSGDDTIHGSTATDYWSLSWGGGNGTYYVNFDDGNGGGYYSPSASFTTYSGSTTYYMGYNQTSKEWYQNLHVSSAGGGGDSDGAYITQTIY